MQKIRCTVENLDLMHIGSGNITTGGRRVLSIQRLNGQPFIPGSTLRGKIRANLQAILPHVRSVAKGPMKDLFDTFTDSEILNKLFGTSDRQGLVVVGNASIKRNTRPDVIPGVRLNPRARSVDTGALFFFEMVPPNSKFNFEVYINQPKNDRNKFGDSYYLLVLLAVRHLEFSGLGRHGARLRVSFETAPEDIKNLEEELMFIE